MSINSKRITREQVRLARARDCLVHWRRWGPYLSEGDAAGTNNLLYRVYL